MVSLDFSPVIMVERLYAESSADPRFAEVLEGQRIETDDDLADLIEVDGRLRLALDRPIELSRYLEAIDDLPARPVALDAAIDVVLRSMSGSRRPDPEAARTLTLNYPHLADTIREATALGISMISTADISRAPEADLPRVLPADFGPVMADGRPRYRLLARLGAGTSGAVFRAADRLLSDGDRPALVAIKMMRFRERSPWARERFIEEATKARRVIHPNAARVLDRGRCTDRTDYIVYEYIDGGDLQSLMEGRSGTMPVRDAVALAARIARGVHAVHMAGLVHCDLKPGNILLTSAREPKVCDFGIAVRSGLAGGGAERAPGSLAFAAPEQFGLADGALAAPADVYAVGGVLYTMLTGLLPNGQTPEEALAGLGSGRAEAPSAGLDRRGVDRDLAAILRRALCPAPGGRHGSAAELASDLESWLAHEPISWVRPSLSRVVRLWALRRPWVAAIVVASMLLVVASVAIAVSATMHARARDAAAALDQSRLDDAKDMVGLGLRAMETLAGKHLGRDLLPMLMVLEGVLGKSVLDVGDADSLLWEKRIGLVGAMVRQAERQGRGGDVDTLMWQGTLGFWLVNEGRAAEAIGVLRENIDRWSVVAGPEDRWVQRLRLMETCASVRFMLDRQEADAQRDASLRAAEEALRLAEAGFVGADSGGPVHQLVLRTLIDIYGPGGLDEPRRQRQVTKRMGIVAG